MTALLETIDQVCARLSAWEESARLMARHLPDSQAKPYWNIAENYAALRGLLERAVEEAVNP